MIVRLTVRLSKVSWRRIDIVSLRDSKAATTSIKEKATRPIVLPISCLPYWSFPKTISRLMATDMNSPTRPTVVMTAALMMEADRGRGMRSMRPGVALSIPSAMPTGAVMTKLIHRIWVAVNGCPPAMLSRLAMRNVTT